jgi:FKBP-type peptidyl-prolyl cis-trans isomerase SlyD
MRDKVEKGKKIRISYTVKVNGEVIETTKGKPPLFYEQGKPQVLASIQNNLEGKFEGEVVKFDLTPLEAYGVYDQSKIQNIPLSEMPPKENLKVGMMLQDKQKDGGVKVGRVKEINVDHVVLDFNHPMAGKTLSYEVDIITVMSGMPLQGGVPRMDFESEELPKEKS